MTKDAIPSQTNNLPRTMLREFVSMVEFAAFAGALFAMWYFGAARSVWVWMAIGLPILIVGVFISALVRGRLNLTKGKA